MSFNTSRAGAKLASLTEPPVEESRENSPAVTVNPQQVGRLNSWWSWWQSPWTLRPLMAWVLCLAAVVAYGIVHLPGALSYRRFGFLDAGSGLAADQLMSRGLLPAVDFGYYHGLLPLLLGRVWFAIFGTNPQAYVGMELLLALVSLLLMFYLFAALRAPRSAYLMLLVSVPFCFYYRPSINHDMAGAAITASLLLLVQRRYGWAASAAMVSAFCHPSLGWVMLGLVPVVWMWTLLNEERLGIGGAVWKVARTLVVSGVATLVAYAAICFAFLHNLKPMLLTLFPVVGSGLRAHYGWSFLKGGLTFIHPHGSNWKYLVGTPAGGYLLFNLVLAAAALGWLVQVIRNRNLAASAMAVVLVCCVAIHSVYLIVAFGVPETWSYDAYLLIIGLAAAPFARMRNVAAFVLAAALLLGDTSNFRGSRELYRQTPKNGLWTEERTRADMTEILRRTPGAQPYVWSMNGALSQIDGRFRSPERWFVVPGTNPPKELARLKAELLANPVVFAFGAPDDPESLFQDADFEALQSDFREAGRIGEFTVYENKAWPPSRTATR